MWWRKSNPEDVYERLKRQIVRKAPLTMTAYQRQMAINRKALFLAWINPMEFISATTDDSKGAFKFIVDKTKDNLEYYNRLHRTNAEDYPYLHIIKKKDGFKIINHDGRSRMLASYLAGYDMVPVFIRAEFRLEDKSDLNFPMLLEFQEMPNEYHKIELDDVIEFYERDSWQGW